MTRSTASGKRPTGRRPGDSGTRDTIAAAARRLFAERGYGAVSVRSVASAAGVDPALVHHFFGTKLALFTELTRVPFDPAVVVPRLLGPGIDGLGERVVRFIVGQLRGPDTGPALVGLIRTAAGHPEAAAAVRERYTEELFEPLVAALEVDRAGLRVALCSAQLLGLAVSGHIIGLTPLLDVAEDDLVAILGDTVQRYLTAPLPG